MQFDVASLYTFAFGGCQPRSFACVSFRSVRWERLFADLEAQVAATEAAELAGEVVERIRHEVGTLRLVDRLRPAEGHPVRLSCVGGEAVEGTLRQVGADWVLVEERAGRQAVVALPAVTSVAGLGALSALPGSEGHVAGTLDLRRAVRGIARDRAGVRVTLVDGGVVVGTIDRVGADFVEIAEHPPGEPRRVRAVRAVRVVPISGLVVVRTAG